MDKKLITPAIIIWQDILKKVPLIELDGNNKEKGSLRWYEYKLKDVVGYRFGNSHKFFQTCLMGKHFSFTVCFHPVVNPKKDFHWDISVWDDTGNRTIGSYRIESMNKETDVMPKEVYNEIIKDCEDDICGFQKCSGCGKKVKHSEVAGQYFAGRYCKTCWEGKYKVIEEGSPYIEESCKLIEEFKEKIEEEIAEKLDRMDYDEIDNWIKTKQQ